MIAPHTIGMFVAWAVGIALGRMPWRRPRRADERTLKDMLKEVRDQEML